MLRFKLIILVLLLPLMIVSCEEKAPISQEDMSKMMYEMYLVDKYVENSSDLLARSDSMYVYSEIFNKFGYSEEDICEALRYYVANPEKYLDILNEVKDMLSVRDEEIVELEKKEDQMEDELEEDESEQVKRKIKPEKINTLQWQ